MTACAEPRHERVTARSFNEKAWKQMLTRLQGWQHNVGSVMGTLHDVQQVRNQNAAAGNVDDEDSDE